MIIWLVVTGRIGNFIIPTDYRFRFFRGVGHSTTLTSSDEKYHGILPCHLGDGHVAVGVLSVKVPQKNPWEPMAKIPGESPPFSTSTLLGPGAGVCIWYVFVLIYYVYRILYIYIYICTILYNDVYYMQLIYTVTCIYIYIYT